jgi:hypothetical protein
MQPNRVNEDGVEMNEKEGREERRKGGLSLINIKDGNTLHKQRRHTGTPHKIFSYSFFPTPMNDMIQGTVPHRNQTSLLF